MQKELVLHPITTIITFIAAIVKHQQQQLIPLIKPEEHGICKKHGVYPY
jgi:hypothetical protein